MVRTLTEIDAIQRKFAHSFGLFQTNLLSRFSNFWRMTFKPIPPFGIPAYHFDDDTLTYSLQVRTSSIPSLLNPTTINKIVDYVCREFHCLGAELILIKIPSGSFPRLQLRFGSLDCYAISSAISFDGAKSTVTPQMMAGAANVAANTQMAALPGTVPTDLPVEEISHIPELLTSMQMYNKSIDYIAFNNYLTATYTNVAPAPIGSKVFVFDLRSALPAKVVDFVNLHDGGTIAFDCTITLSGSSMMTGAVTIGKLFSGTDATLQNLQLLDSTIETSAGTNTIKHSFRLHPQAQLGTTLPAGFDFKELFKEAQFSKYYPNIVGLVSANIQQGFGQDLALTARLDVKLAPPPYTKLIVKSITTSNPSGFSFRGGGVPFSNFLHDDCYLYTDSSVYIKAISGKPKINPLIIVDFKMDNNGSVPPIMKLSYFTTPGHSHFDKVSVFPETADATIFGPDDGPAQFGFPSWLFNIKRGAWSESKFTINGLQLTDTEINRFSATKSYIRSVQNGVGLGFGISSFASTSDDTETEVVVTTPQDSNDTIVTLDSASNITLGSFIIEHGGSGFSGYTYGGGIGQFSTAFDTLDVIDKLASVSDLTDVIAETLQMPANCRALRTTPATHYVPPVASGVIAAPTFPGEIDLYASLSRVFDPNARGVRKTASIVETNFGKRVGTMYYDSINAVVGLLRTREYELCSYTTSQLQLVAITDYVSDSDFVTDNSQGWVARQISSTRDRIAYSSQFRQHRYASSINNSLTTAYNTTSPQGAALSGMAFNGAAAGQYMLGQKKLDFLYSQLGTQSELTREGYANNLAVTMMQGENSTRNILTQAIVNGSATPSSRIQRFVRAGVGSDTKTTPPDLSSVPYDLRKVHPLSPVPQYPGQTPRGQYISGSLPTDNLASVVDESPEDVGETIDQPSTSGTQIPPSGHALTSRDRGGIHHDGEQFVDRHGDPISVDHGQTMFGGETGTTPGLKLKTNAMIARENP